MTTHHFITSKILLIISMQASEVNILIADGSDSLLAYIRSTGKPHCFLIYISLICWRVEI